MFFLQLGLASATSTVNAFCPKKCSMLAAPGVAPDAGPAFMALHVSTMLFSRHTGVPMLCSSGLRYSSMNSSSARGSLKDEPGNVDSTRIILLCTLTRKPFSASDSAVIRTV